MTVSAHNNRRVWGGASLARNVEPGTEQRVSLYRLLHPQMYPKQQRQQPRQKPPSIEERHTMIFAYLRDKGPSTAQAIEAEYNLNRDAIGGLLRNGIDGIVALRKERSAQTKRLCIVYGLQDIHTAGEAE